MTRRDALAEARRRWGHTAYVWIDDLGGRHQHVVGPGRNVPIGAGDTWEAAFADADRRERRKAGRKGDGTR